MVTSNCIGVVKNRRKYYDDEELAIGTIIPAEKLAQMSQNSLIACVSQGWIELIPADPRVNDLVERLEKLEAAMAKLSKSAPAKNRPATATRKTVPATEGD